MGEWRSKSTHCIVTHCSEAVATLKAYVFTPRVSDLCYPVVGRLEILTSPFYLSTSAFHNFTPHDFVFNKSQFIHINRFLDVDRSDSDCHNPARRKLNSQMLSGHLCFNHVRNNDSIASFQRQYLARRRLVQLTQTDFGCWTQFKSCYLSMVFVDCHLRVADCIGFRVPTAAPRVLATDAR